MRKNNREIKIVESLHRYGGHMTISEIAKASEMSFPTTKKYIKGLEKEKIVRREGKKYLVNYNLILGKEYNKRKRKKVL